MRSRVDFAVRVWLHLAFAGLLLTGQAHAQQEVLRTPFPTQPPISMGIGAGLRMGSSLYRNQDAYLDVVPLYLFEGKYLFAHGTTAGVHLFRNRRWSFDALARYRFDQFQPDADPQTGLVSLRERRQTVDAGLAGEFHADWGDLRVVWVADTLNRHNGNQVELTWRRNIDRGDLTLAPFMTVFWQDSDLTGYYYGVDADEASTDTPAYQPGSALNVQAGINTSYLLTDNVFVYANLALNAYDSTIMKSPLVDSSVDVTTFIGAGYVFGGPHKSRGRFGRGQGLWTWRVNWARTAEENIFPWLMSGSWASNHEADTSLAGLTVGRLLRPGERGDIYGRVAVYRHFENGLQDDTWSVATYLMAIGKGYLPWSDKLAFRWGFGFGASYAAEILAIEKIKQANRGDRTSHLLTYLEWQFDIPLENFIDSRMTRNCFVGVSAVHRSGIFGSADLLGDVSGGSDFLGMHYECVR